MTSYFDNLETRSEDERANDLSKQLPAQIHNAKENSRAFKQILKEVDPADIKSIEDLTRLPVLRKSELVKLQNKRNILFCGSYFGYGFHEDGIKSSIEMLKNLND